MIPPRQDRDWAPEYAKPAYATINGDLVTVHNIRNFDYRTETDFTPRYYDKTFDLRKLDSADIIASYWMGDAIAHIFVSFGFDDKDFLAISVETRRERTESYSSIAGFFKQYELFYVVADERDLIRVWTNYRKDPPEDVYLYRTRAPVANVRRLFRLHPPNKLAGGKTGILQYTHNQLYHGYFDAYSSEPWPASAFMENSSERLHPSLPLRAQNGRHGPSL